jgi:hypothetical protein
LADRKTHLKYRVCVICAHVVFRFGMVKSKLSKKDLAELEERLRAERMEYRRMSDSMGGTRQKLKIPPVDNTLERYDYFVITVQ